MNKDAHNSSPPKRKTPFVFYIILVAIPILFFVVLEIVLHSADYGHDYQVFKEKDEGVPGVLYVNPKISYKYFGNLSSTVFNAEVGFYADKPDNGFRIFVLGASSTQGFPYNPQASFPSHLQRRLELLYPDKFIEVINLGASAINSYTIRDILPDVIAESPDLILIYAGHNEFYGALGAGSARTVRPALANFLLYLRDFRTVQMLENFIANISRNTGNQDKSLMQKMIGESQIDFESAIYQKGLEQYETNLSAILRDIDNAEIPVIIGTLTSNLSDQKPFNASQKSEEGLSANDYYLQGKNLMADDKLKEARASFIKAKEYDGLRFRAPEKINEIIKEQAKAFQIPVADIEAKFSQNSPDKITGASLICDHLHPNLAGYFLMSKIFTEAIWTNSFLSEPGQMRYSSQLDSILLNQFPYTAFDTIVDNHILYSGLGQYPFVAPGKPNPYQQFLDQDGVNFNTSSINEMDSVRTLIASNHLQNGDTQAFVNEMRVFMSHFPYNEARYLRAINLLSKDGALDKGYPILFKSLQNLKETKAKSIALGSYYKFMQQYDSSLFYLSKALKASPNDDFLLLDIGFVHLGLADYSNAEAVFTQVIQKSPDNQEAFHQRSVARFELKNYAGTIEDINASMNLKDKADTLSYLIRGYAYLGVNDRKSACQDWKSAAQLGSRQGQMLTQNYCGN